MSKVRMTWCGLADGEVAHGGLLVMPRVGRLSGALKKRGRTVAVDVQPWELC
jgi:hypothetical protein